MFLFSYTAAILAFTCLGIAAFIFYKKNTYYLAQYFSTYIVCVGLWIGANTLADFALTDFTVRLWSGFSLITGVAYISFYLLFVEAFITEARVSRKKQILLFLPILFFSMVAFTPLYVVKTFITPGIPAQIMAGPVYYFVLAFTFGGLPYGLWKLFRTWPKSSPQKKNQIFYIAVGFTMVLLGAIIFTVILPIALAEFRFYTLGPQFALFTIIGAAYAIFKHRLLDIKIVLQLSLIYTILLSLLVVLYVVTLFFMFTIFNDQERLSFFLSALATTIIGAYTMPILEKRFRTATDPFFFKEKYDLSKAVEDLSDQLSRSNSLEDLIRHTAPALQNILRAQSVYFSLIPEYTEVVNFYLGSSTALALTTLLPQSIPTENKPQTLVESATQPFRIISPLVVEHQCLGVILVGPKRSGEQYVDDDYRLLKTFCGQAAVALKKARLYQQVVDYSENLMEKVTERTREIKNLQEHQAQLMIDISHELQTPLTIIKGELGLLHQALPNNTALSTFEKATDRISRFIRDLLRLAKLEANHEISAKCPVEFSELVAEVMEYVTILADNAAVKIIAKIEPGITVYGNREQLEQLITNLLSNALKYIANARRVEVLVKDDTQIYLQINDTGIGIAPEQLPNLFKRFNRLGQNTNQPGTGLGLAMCEQIIKNHNGTIAIESKLGIGTTVSVILPRE